MLKNVMNVVTYLNYIVFIVIILMFCAGAFKVFFMNHLHLTFDDITLQQNNRTNGYISTNRKMSSGT